MLLVRTTLKMVVVNDSCRRWGLDDVVLGSGSREASSKLSDREDADANKRGDHLRER